MSLTDDGVENFRNQKKTKIKSYEKLVMAFLVAKNKAKRLEDIPPPEIDAYSSEFLWSARKTDIWQCCLFVCF